MRIGVGLPTTVPDLDARRVLDWARRAETHGFASLGVLDRLVYSNYEPMTALAAAAAATTSIDLVASVFIAPYRLDTAVFAKQAATVHALSGGRLTLGVSAGLRKDDFEVAGARFGDRGARLDSMIERCKNIWSGTDESAGDGIGPVAPQGGPALMVGGNSEAAYHRAARYADGWVAGASSPSQYAQTLREVQDIWAAHGRTEPVRTQAVVFFALGPDGAACAERHLLRYYEFLGPHATVMARKAVTGRGQLRELIDGYREAGCQELLLFSCSSEPRQLDLLAHATTENSLLTT